jgi:hypothetical protein
MLNSAVAASKAAKSTPLGHRAERLALRLSGNSNVERTRARRDRHAARSPRFVVKPMEQNRPLPCWSQPGPAIIHVCAR